MNNRTCFKCGTHTGTIIKHHTSYVPEVIVDCCRACHTKIHHKIRKLDKCKYTRDEVNFLSRELHRKRFIKKINFFDAIFPNIGLYEDVVYDESTGNLAWSSYFKADHNKSLWYEDI